MGRAYAGILGFISFGVVIARSLVDGSSTEAALRSAPLVLFVFAAIGYFIGSIAEKTIVEAIETKFHAELQASETASTTAIRGVSPAKRSDRSA